MQANYVTAEHKQTYEAATVQLFKRSKSERKDPKHPGFKNNVTIVESAALMTISGICLPPYMTKRRFFLAGCSGLRT